MKDIEPIENIGEDNLRIAISEKDFAKNLKAMAKMELDRAKARENFTEKELKLSNFGEKMAKKARELTEKKVEILASLQDRGILPISDEDIIREKDYAVYHEKVANIRKEMAQTNSKIANQERELCNEKLEFAENKYALANLREQLAKKQLRYVKMVRGNQPDEKVLEAEKDFLKQEQELVDTKKKVIKTEMKIRTRENKLNDLKKDYSTKIAKLENVKYPI